MNLVRGKQTLLLAVFALASQTLYAHTGVGTAAGFTSGVVHPLLGADHMLAMVAVGIWASQLGGAARWKLPLAFVGAMLIGAGLAFAGIGLPLVEPGIAASVFVLGLLIASSLRASPAVALGTVGLFAVLHGHAHGTELPLAASAVGYTLGFVFATVILHLSGVGIGQLLHRSRTGLLRLGGVSVAGAGAWLLLGV